MWGTRPHYCISIHGYIHASFLSLTWNIFLSIFVLKPSQISRVGAIGERMGVSLGFAIVFLLRIHEDETRVTASHQGLL